MAATERDRARTTDLIVGGFAADSEPQKRFLACSAFEALYGGAAGGGKTIALVIDALRYVDVGFGKSYEALILRRTYPELEKSVMREAARWYPILGGRWNEQKKRWRFPGGETIHLGHCQHEEDVLQYQGAEFQFVGFDETTHFTESQWVYLIGRLRTTAGIPLRIRGATNPGGPGHEWVFNRFRPWLDPKAEQRAAPGAWRWYLPRVSGGGEDYVPRGTTREISVNGARVSIAARSRTFIGAKATDNRFVGSDYITNLYAQQAVLRAQLLDGDWLAKASAGTFFRRTWLHPFRVDSLGVERFVRIPAGVRRIRYWDRAATPATEANRDPDWTRGVRLGIGGGRVFIDDLVSLRGTPQQNEALIRATAASDGVDVIVGLEQDPGSAGVNDIAYMMQVLRGHHVRTFKPTKDKVTRAGPLSSQVEHGNVHICFDPSNPPKWLEEFFAELEAFPEGAHDDIVDACSGAYNALVGTPPPSRGVITAWPGL